MADAAQVTTTAMTARFQAQMTRATAQLRLLGDAAVREQMRDVHRVLVLTSPVDTGRLRASWPPPTPRGDLTWGTGTTLYYAATLEYGGYRRVGPRTVELGGGALGAGFVADSGIYSQQAPLGFVRRALAAAAPQFRQRLLNAAAQAWRLAGGGLGAAGLQSTVRSEALTALAARAAARRGGL